MKENPKNKQDNWNTHNHHIKNVKTRTAIEIKYIYRDNWTLNIRSEFSENSLICRTVFPTEFYKTLNYPKKKNILFSLPKLCFATLVDNDI